MIPYLLAVAGGYIIGNAFKDDTPSFDKGGVVDPKMLYERLREAEMNFSKDDGAEYYKIQKEISENRKLYFKKLGEAEMNWNKDDGAEYTRLMAMRDSFAKGGMMMAKGGKFLNYFEIYDEMTGKTLYIEAFSFEQAEEIASEIEFNDFNDGEQIEYEGRDTLYVPKNKK